MARGGARKGAGRPKLSEIEKLSHKEEKLYRNYLNRWHEAKAVNKYGMVDNPLNKKTFLEAYYDAKKDGAYHPIRAIIKEDILYSRSQSRAWAKNLNRNLKKWREEGVENESLKEILSIMGNGRFYVDSFYEINSKKVADVLDIITTQDLWDTAVGS